MKIRLTKRRLLAIAVLLLSAFLCVTRGMELPGTIRNAEYNQCSTMFHWSTMGTMLLALAAPVCSIGILFRHRISAYACLLSSLYWLSWLVFLVWFNHWGFRPGQPIVFPLLLMLAAAAIYFIRTSRRKEGETRAGPSWRALGIGSGATVLLLFAVFRVTLTEDLRFMRTKHRADALRAAGDYDGALAILFDLSSRNPDVEYLHREIGRIHIARGEFEAAITEFTKCCENAASWEHRNPQYYMDRGYAFRKAKQFKKSEDDFDRAMQLVDQTDEIAAHHAKFEPTEPLTIRSDAHNAELLSSAHLGRGHARTCLRNLARAREDYKAVVELAVSDEEVEEATRMLTQIQVWLRGSQR